MERDRDDDQTRIEEADLPGNPEEPRTPPPERPQGPPPEQPRPQEKPPERDRGRDS